MARFSERSYRKQNVFWFSLQLLSETFLVLRSTERDVITNVYWSSCKILMTLEFSRQICEKYSNIKFHQNPSSGSRVVPRGRTDGQTDMTKLIVAFRNVAKAPKREENKNTSKWWKPHLSQSINADAWPADTIPEVFMTNITETSHNHCPTYTLSSRLCDSRAPVNITQLLQLTC